MSLVAVAMGSDSDLPKLSPAVEILNKLSIKTEVRILSAHRTPLEMVEFAKKASSRGFKVIIAGAGGAAHLPGMIASLTPLPVIGVPIKTKSLSGVDSMLSILQMPKGIPVATVAIDGGLNAGLLAAQILGIENLEIRQKIENYRSQLNKEVKNKDSILSDIGTNEYLQKDNTSSIRTSF